MKNKTFTEGFVEYAQEFTDCPAVLLKWSALLAVSVVLGRKVFLRVGSWDAFGNLWLILIGPSSAHKSTALNIAEALIDAVLPDSQLAQEWSSERLLEDLQTNPQRVMLYDEARTFFDACGKKYNAGVMSVLTQLWAKTKYRRVTKAGAINIDNVYLCFGGASTPEWITEGIRDKESAILSGYLPRFLLVEASATQNKSYPFPPPADFSKKTILIHKLEKIAQTEGEFTFTADARKDYERWYETFREKVNLADLNARPFLAKIWEVYSLRLAIVLAADRGTFPWITIEVWQETKRMLGYLERTIYGIVAQVMESKWDKERAKIEKEIKDSAEITRSELSNRTRVFGNRLRAYLDDLETAGRIEVIQVEKTGGRPSQKLKYLYHVGNGD